MRNGAFNLLLAATTTAQLPSSEPSLPQQDESRAAPIWSGDLRSPRQRSENAPLLSVDQNLHGGLANLSLPSPNVVADRVFVNGNICPLTNGTNLVAALAVTDGRIVAVGDSVEVSKLKGERTQVVNLEGRMMLPAFTDAHYHPIWVGLNAATQCDLIGAKTREEVSLRLQKYAKSHPNRPWIQGYNFESTAFGSTKAPKEFLKGIVPGDSRPVCLGTQGHSIWVSELGLKLAGINAQTPDNNTIGFIERMPNSKEPSGALFDGAMTRVLSLLPQPTDNERVAALEAGVKMLNKHGIVNFIDAFVTTNDFAAYQALAAEGRLSAYATLSAFCDLAKGLEGAREAIATIRRFQKENQFTNLIAPRQVKLFIDGVVEEKTGAMHEAYTGTKEKGNPAVDQATLNQVVAMFDREGIQIHAHATGDLAVTMILDAFEHALKQNRHLGARHHVAHLCVVRPEDQRRFAELGVYSNWQAHWIQPDGYIEKVMNPLLGPSRATNQYPIGTVIRAGGSAVFGSDSPVTPEPNIFDALEKAVRRRDVSADGNPQPAWTAFHCIGTLPVIYGYTVKGAEVTFREREIGTLAPGKAADLVVLDTTNLFTLRDLDLHAVKVLQTFHNGTVVYSNSSNNVSRVIGSK